MIHANFAKTDSNIFLMSNNLLSTEYSNDLRDLCRHYLIKSMAGWVLVNVAILNTNALRTIPNEKNNDLTILRYRLKAILVDSNSSSKRIRQVWTARKWTRISKLERFSVVIKENGGSAKSANCG
ncbi:MAG: hypothetical protein ACTS8H_04795 [Arsenophonus sp. NC-PE1-MAG3]